jgi:hypothetical protein
MNRKIALRETEKETQDYGAGLQRVRCLAEGLVDGYVKISSAVRHFNGHMGVPFLKYQLLRP